MEKDNTFVYIWLIQAEMTQKKAVVIVFAITGIELEVFRLKYILVN